MIRPLQPLKPWTFYVFSRLSFFFKEKNTEAAAPGVEDWSKNPIIKPPSFINWIVGDPTAPGPPVFCVFFFFFPKGMEVVAPRFLRFDSQGWREWKWMVGRGNCRNPCLVFLGFWRKQKHNVGDPMVPLALLSCSGSSLVVVWAASCVGGPGLDVFFFLFLGALGCWVVGMLARGAWVDLVALRKSPWLLWGWFGAEVLWCLLGGSRLMSLGWCLDSKGLLGSWLRDLSGIFH